MFSDVFKGFQGHSRGFVEFQGFSETLQRISGVFKRYKERYRSFRGVIGYSKDLRSVSEDLRGLAAFKEIQGVL